MHQVYGIYGILSNINIKSQYEVEIINKKIEKCRVF